MCVCGGGGGGGLLGLGVGFSGLGTQLRDFAWQQSPKYRFLGQRTKLKNYTYLSSIFNSNNLFKDEKSTFTANLKVRPWYLTRSFPLNAFRGLYFSHVIRLSLAYLTLSRSLPKRILGNSAIARA